MNTDAWILIGIAAVGALILLLLGGRDNDNG